MLMKRCLIKNNYADQEGGGIWIRGENASAEIRNTIIRENSSNGDGGGLFLNWGAKVTLIGALVVENDAVDMGAGIVNLGSELTIINSTFANNTSGYSPDVYANNSEVPSQPSTTIINSIIWTPAPNHADIGTGTYDVTYSVLYDVISGTGNIFQDPEFEAPGSYNLLAESPAINAGNPDTTGLNLTLFDQGGNPRILEGRIDIGAYEKYGEGSGLFTDPNLEQAVADALECAIEELNETKLLELSNLDAFDSGINDLTGLEYCTNLKYTRLENNNISDLSPLSGLPNLVELGLFNNSITDITPLQTITSLTHLNFVDNLITNISPLSSLTDLKALYLGGNNVSDYSPLYSLNLDLLELNDCNISDISFLLNMQNSITWLELGLNQISDLVPLQDLFFVEYLDISYNPLTEDDLGVVAVQMTALTNLKLDGIPLTSLGNLSGITTLTDLSIIDCGVSDLSPLLNLTNLTYVNAVMNPLSADSRNEYIPALEENGVTVEHDHIVTSGLFNDLNLEQAIANTLGYAPDELNETNLLELTELYAQYYGFSDLTGLELCTNLEILFLDGNSITDISPLQGLSNLNHLSVSENQITDLTPLQNHPNLVQLIINRNNISDLSSILSLNQLQILEK